MCNIAGPDIWQISRLEADFHWSRAGILRSDWSETEFGFITGERQCHQANWGGSGYNLFS